MHIFLLLFNFCFAGEFSVTLDSQKLVNVPNVSTKYLESDSMRRYLLIRNNGTTDILVRFKIPDIGGDGILIPPGGNFEPGKAIYDALYIRSISGTNSVTIIEGH